MLMTTVTADGLIVGMVHTILGSMDLVTMVAVSIGVHHITITPTTGSMIRGMILGIMVMDGVVLGIHHTMVGIVPGTAMDLTAITDGDMDILIIIMVVMDITPRISISMVLPEHPTTVV